MKRCQICKKNYILFSKKNYCENCKKILMTNIGAITSNIDSLNSNLLNRNKKIEYYLKTYEGLLELNKKLNYFYLLAPDIITECTTQEKFIDEVNMAIKEKVDEKIKIIIEKNSICMNGKRISNDLKKLYVEVSECKITYNIFRNTLEKCQKIIKNKLYSLDPNITHSTKIIMIDDDTGEILDELN